MLLLLKILPSIVSGLLLIVSQVGLPDVIKAFIETDPARAMGYAAMYALVKGLLPSPVSVGSTARAAILLLMLPFGLTSCSATTQAKIENDLVKIEASVVRDLVLVCKAQPDIARGIVLAAQVVPRISP